jgi:hypothetical protein
MYRSLTIALIVILLMVGCAEKQDPKKAVGSTLKTDAEKFFRFNNKTTINIVPSKTPGLSNIDVVYPYPNFNPQTSVDTMTNPIGNMMDGFFKTDRTVESVTITVRDTTVTGPVIGVFRITQPQFREAKKSNPVVYRALAPFFELDGSYLIQMNLNTVAKSAKDLSISRSVNETNNLTTVTVAFRLERKSDARVKNSPLDSINVFEELVSNIVKTTFETDQTIDDVVVSADVIGADERDNISTHLADFKMSRPEFLVINERWDNLRYKIYDRISYAPLYLADYISLSAVLSIDYNDTTVIYLYDEDQFKNIDTTVAHVSTDIAALVKRFFASYPLIDSLEIHAKAKIPAVEGKVSPDGIHQIVEDFVVVSVDRSTFDTLEIDKLTNEQQLFNFETVWDRSVLDLKVRSDLFGAKTYFRSISFPQDNDAVIDLDSCVLVTDPLIKGKINMVIQQYKDGQMVSLEDEVYEVMGDTAKKLMYNIHPPYLESVTFNLMRVYRDTTGQEIEVKDLGSVTFVRQPDVNYWFQTLDPAEITWIEEGADSLDIADEEVLCQI